MTITNEIGSTIISTILNFQLVRFDEMHKVAGENNITFSSQLKMFKVVL